MKIGGLYSYSDARALYPVSNYLEKGECISSIEENELFVLLDYSESRSKVKRCKILTSKGIMGWIYLSPSDNVKEITEGEL
jgi:hypothetical protein